MDKIIDLHVHSKFSDGKNTVREIIEMAKANNVGYLAFAEHYNISSYSIAKDLAGKDIKIIPAIEVGTSLDSYGLGRKNVCHLVAYYPNNFVYRILDDYEINRDKCVRETIAKLNEANIPLTYAEVAVCSRNSLSIGRFDIAIAMVRFGFVKNTATAYCKYLNAGCAAYVQREKMSPISAIKELKKIGAIVSLAHPRSMRIEDAEQEYKILRDFKDAGLSCIEVYTPVTNQEKRDHFNQISQEFDLIPISGSDYHGNLKPKIEVGLGINGNLNISDYSIIERLFKKRDQPKALR